MSHGHRNQNIKHKQYCNKFNNLKIYGPHQKKSLKISLIVIEHFYFALHPTNYTAVSAQYLDKKYTHREQRVGLSLTMGLETAAAMTLEITTYKVSLSDEHTHHRLQDLRIHSSHYPNNWSLKNILVSPVKSHVFPLSLGGSVKISLVLLPVSLCLFLFYVPTAQSHPTVRDLIVLL